MNADYILREVRDMIGETAASHWTDVGLLDKLNFQQSRLFIKAALAPADWFVASSSVTATAGVITLPTDCAKPVALEDSSGNAVPFVLTVRERSLTNALGESLTGAYRDSYFTETSITVNDSSFGDTCTLFYIKRLPKLICGQADTGSTTNSIVVPISMRPMMVDDYYNNATIEWYGASTQIRSVVSDYAYSTRVMTVTGTVTAGDYFGTIPRLPEEMISALPIMTAVHAMAKPGSNIDPKYFQYLQTQETKLLEAIDDWVETRASASKYIRRVEVY